MSFCSDIQLYLRLNLVFSLRMLSTLDAGFLVVNTSRENQPCMDVGEACSGPISTLHTAGSHLAVLPPPPPLRRSLSGDLIDSATTPALSLEPFCFLLFHICPRILLSMLYQRALRRFLYCQTLESIGLSACAGLTKKFFFVVLIFPVSR